MTARKDNISICPNELKLILIAVNELPQDLKKFEDDLNELSEQFFGEYYGAVRNHGNNLNYGNELLQRDWSKLQAVYNKKLRQIITPTLAEIINLTVEGNGFQDAEVRLNWVIIEKSILLNIIGSFQKWVVGHNRQLFPKPEFKFEKPPTKYSFNEDTSLEFLSSEVLEIISKNKIPIERIRICRACRKNIFWAKRSDSPTCSSRCSNTLNKGKSEIRKRIKAIEETLDKELKKLEKQKASLGFEHPMINKQMKILNELYNKLDTEKLKNGTL